MRKPKKPPDRTGDKPGAVVAWARYYALVLEFLGYLAVLGYLGHLADERYGWKPWGLLGGLWLGLAAGIYRLVRQSLKDTK